MNTLDPIFRCACDLTQRQVAERLRTAGASYSDAREAVSKIANWWSLPEKIEVTLVFENQDGKDKQSE